MTPELRAKVFGLNATRPCDIKPAEVIKRARSERIYRQRQAYRRQPNPHYLTYGPKTRRDLLRPKHLNGGQPT